MKVSAMAMPTLGSFRTSTGNERAHAIACGLDPVSFIQTIMPARSAGFSDARAWATCSWFVNEGEPFSRRT